MRDKLFPICLYADLALNFGMALIDDTKELVREHKSEIKCIAATSVVVGVTARVVGFKAGYEYAMENSPA